MFSARDVLESYCGGEFVEATELRAAVAVLLSAWEDVNATAVHVIKTAPDKRCFDQLSAEILRWDIRLENRELDVESVVALPDFVAERNARPRVSPGPME